MCIVVGNGPSLNKVDFALLEDQDVFISNYAFFDPRLLAAAKYLCIVNYLVAEQEASAINALSGTNKLFPYWLGYCLEKDPDTYFFPARAEERFSTDAARSVSWRSTVTFSMLQIAYALGYRKVLLIGFDHSYQQSAGAAEGDVLRQDGDDQNHFRASYFKGKLWQAASVANMERTYERSRRCFELDGREIVNCTAGGNLETFRRGELAEELVNGCRRIVVKQAEGGSLGFRVRNVFSQIFRFFASRSGVFVGAVLFFLVAINGSIADDLIGGDRALEMLVDALSFFAGFLLVGYLYVKFSQPR